MNLYCEEIVKMINAVADGKQARDIPYYDPKPMVLFNYPYMVDFGLSPKNCPPGTIYLNAPPTFLRFWNNFSWLNRISASLTPKWLWHWRLLIYYPGNGIYGRMKSHIVLTNQ